MAIVVPFLVKAGATALGMSATAATIASVATSVVFSVTGVNDKINRAASKVFGEDLVNFANIAGAGYAMFNGGFDIGDGAEAVDGLSAADAAFEADFAAASGGSAMAGEEILTSGMDSFNLSDFSTGGSDLDSVVDTTGGSSESFNLQEAAASDAADKAFESDWANATGKSAVSADQPLDVLTNQTGGIDGAPLQAPQASTADATTVSATADPYNAATTPKAAGIDAAQGIRSNSGGLSIKAPPNALDNTMGGGDTNFSKLVNRLLYNNKGELNERLIGGVLQGGGAITASYLQRRAQQEATEQERDYQRARRDTRPVMNYLRG